MNRSFRAQSASQIRRLEPPPEPASPAAAASVPAGSASKQARSRAGALRQPLPARPPAAARPAARRALGRALALAAVSSWLAGCPAAPPAAVPSPDLAVPLDLSAPDLATKDASSVDLATPYVQQPGCSRDAWCWLFPQPQGNTLWSVWGSSATDVWAAGDAGALVHFTGGSWQSVLSPTSAALRGLWGSGPDAVFAVGEAGTVLRYDGTKWRPLALPASQPRRITTLYGASGQGPSDVWFVGAGGVALHYDGVAMTEVPTPDIGTLRAVASLSAASTYAVASLGAGIELLRYDPVAKSFSLLTTIATPSEPTALWGSADSDLFIGGSGGEIYHYDGAAVTTVHPKSSYGINALWGRGAQVFAVGDVQYTDVVTRDITVRKGSFLMWNGTAFVEVAGAPQAGFLGLWGSGPGDVFLVGSSGTIGHFDGAAFTTTSAYEPLTGVGAAMTGLASPGASELLAVGDFGATLRWDGSRWTPLPSNVHVRFRGAAGAGSSLFAIAQDLTMTTGSQAYRFTGTAWAAETVPAGAELRAVWARGSLALAVGADDLVLQRGGTAWSRVPVQGAGTTVLRAAYAVDATHLWAVGGGDRTDSTAAHPARALFSAGGSSYAPMPLPVTDVILRGLWGAAPGDVWAVGDAGTVLHWDGIAWQPVTTATLATLRAVWGRDATTVYAAGSGGTILRWNGVSWTSEDSGTGNTLVSLWGTAQDVYALGTSGTILHKSLR